MMANLSAVEHLLTQDPIWSAYALADLEPEHQAFCTWSLQGKSLLLIYRGLEPPVLFLEGDADDLSEMLQQIAAGTYQYSCRPNHLDLIQRAFQRHSSEAMWRMHYRVSSTRSDEIQHITIRLKEDHLDEVQTLFAGDPDAPDAFTPAQLSSGVFYGVYDGDRLVAAAGTHVRSSRHKLAAIGNVFTHKAHRGKGLGSATTAAVVQGLLAEGIETIVLNVSQSNAAALKAYVRIGFHPHCAYCEGYAKRI